MKNIISLFCAIVFVSTLQAQKKYNISFDKNDFIFIESNVGYSILYGNNDYFLLEDTTLPALPYKSVNILIPNNTDINNISVTKTEINVLEKARIVNNPTVMPVSNLQKQTTSKVDYTEDKYPTENVQFQRKNIMQGFTFVSFIVCPFIYNVKEEKLIMITNFEISFNVTNETSTKSESVITKRYDMEDVITNLVINSSEISTLYATELKSTTIKSTSSDVEYLIITSEGLVNDFVPLKAWKIQKGIKTEIISTNDIYSNYTGTTNQLKIKYCLLDYYNNRNLKWVLLGGDNTIVPVQECYGRVGSSWIDETIPCDLFYACFDNTFNWDYNGNGIIGETTDDIDMSPEIYIARAPIRTSEHVKAFINKTLEYEKNPISSNYVNTLLLTGTKLWNTWDGESDAHQRSERMYSTYISPDWNGIKTKFYDTGTDFPGNASYDLNSTNLQTQLNTGFHFVHMATHGGQITWGMETGISYNSTNAANLSNQKKAIITTIACNTNAFDNAKYTSDPCLSEAFLRNPNGGCVLYIGSSRYGWGYSNLSTNLGPSFQYNAQFFSNLFKGEPSLQSYKFGAINTISKSHFIASSSNYGAHRWLQFSLNAIGDPTLSIFTDNPSEFSNASVTQTGTTVTVNTGGVSGCTIALTSMDFGTTYFDVKEGSSAIFSSVNFPYYVTITKHNYKPFQYPTDVYIQNYTFNSDAYIDGRNIYVGNNVIPSSTQGDVIIKNGVNVIFEAVQNMNFDSGFEAELGSTFEVR
jgi:hypothetical protein